MRFLRSVIPALLILLAPVLAAPDTVVARVGDRVITQADLDLQFELFLRQSAGGIQLSDETKAELMGLKKQYLERMVQDLVLVQEAERRGLAPSRELVDRRVQQSKESLASEAAFQAALKSYGIPDEATFWQMTYDSMAYKALISDVRKRMQISSPAIKMIYLLSRDRFVEPELYCSSHIMLKTREEAEDVIRQLDEGADFARLAMSLSEDKISGARGGEVGCLPRGKLVPEYEAAMLKLKPGEYTKTPVHTQYGWHVILLTKHVPAREIGYPEAWGQIHDEIENRALELYIKNLVKHADVEIYPDRVQ
ncbi:peptidylprolyl isomerase [Oceanithermus sp.]